MPFEFGNVVQVLLAVVGESVYWPQLHRGYAERFDLADLVTGQALIGPAPWFRPQQGTRFDPRWL